MDKIKEFVANIISGDNVAAKNVFNEMIYARSLEKLEERKQEIAENLFKTEEVETLEEGPIGAALGGGLGAMAGGPLGAALGGALGHAAGEVAPGVLKKVGKVAKKVAGIGGGAVLGGALGGPLGALGGGYLGHRMTKEEAEELEEKAVSQQQQKFMGMVYAAKKGKMPASPEVAKAAKGMTKQQAKDYAATKHAGLPKKIEQEGWFGGDDKPTPPPKPEPKQPSTPPPSGSSSPSVGGAVGAIKSRQKMLDDI